MATKNYLDLTGLSQYDSLIKQYIGTEDAKSIKSITVVGNTVSFFKTADASGTASYTVTLPDVSNFMELIASATGNKVVKSNADGSVSETNIAVSDVVVQDDISAFVTGYFEGGEPQSGEILVYGGDQADVITSGIICTDLATNAYVGAIPQSADATTVVGYVDEAIDDALDTLGTAASADVATTAIVEDSTDDNLVSAAQVAAFVATEIAGLEGAMHFRGVITRQTGETDAQAIARVITDPEAGDVVVMADNAKEYIYQSSTVGWKEVGDETEFVKKITTIAGVDLQDSITKTELLTALNVEDGAEVNDIASVKVNGTALTPDANKAVNVTVAEGSTNGTVAVNGTDVAVHGLGSAAYTASSAYDAAGSASTAEQNAKDYADSLAPNYDAAGTADAAIADLDASVSQTAGTDGLALSVTEVDGVITSISGSIAQNTYEPYGIGSISNSDIEDLFE